MSVMLVVPHGHVQAALLELLQYARGCDHGYVTTKNRRNDDSQSRVHRLEHDAIRMQAARAAGVAEGKAAAAIETTRCAATLRDG